jgi:type II secretory pathway predicted ATPase ExeA
MSSSIYEASKDVFLDLVDYREYVQLDRLSIIYQSLKDAIKKPLKMVLLFGKPGTGKSMFLSKLYNDLSATQLIFLYQTPILDESEFYKTLAQDIFSTKYDDELNFTQFMKIANAVELSSIPVVLLDEAQLYSDLLMEKIRLISDTRMIKFVITLHKTEREDLVAKEHFKTRIWETIELENASNAELKIYIQKKLMKANCLDVAHMFSNKNIHMIYKFTHGNYRDTNKLLYTLFEIYTLYEEQRRLSSVGTTQIYPKFIEMAAIQTGLIDA